MTVLPSFPAPLLTAAFSTISRVPCELRHCRATRSSGQVEAINFEAQADANDDANAVADLDSDADAEYETDPEFLLPRRSPWLSTSAERAAPSVHTVIR
ncbi:hypothetical protein PG996_002968 [Apiospora saccharicola]|uniref:Secreted protein n=1 Tax=Apiospora saccharicola TaxID=335842 RepID=A0ABR1W014_9PEZI